MNNQKQLKAYGKHSYKPNSYRFDSNGVKAYFGTYSGTGENVHIKMVPVRPSSCCADAKGPSFDSANEIQLLSKFKGTHITQLLEVAETQHNMFIVTQRGITNLQDFMPKLKSEARILQIFMDVLIGVSLIRSFGYIHCDVSAKNVEIHQDHAKVNGIEACIPLGRGKKVQKGHWIKNNPFPAPQQVKQIIFTEKTMIWNIGALLYYMIFKQYPLQSKSYNCNTKKSPQKEQQSSLFNFLEGVLIGCLNLNVDSRFNLSGLLQFVMNYQSFDDEFGQIMTTKSKYLMQSYKLPDSNKIFIKQNIEQEISNEINYIMFLERSCFLFERMQIKIVEPPLLSLTKFIICCRVHRLNKSKYWKGKNINEELAHDFAEMFQQYGKGIVLPEVSSLGEEYSLFQQNNYQHREIIYLHYQAFLRNFIIEGVQTLKRQNLQFLNASSYTVYAVDFAISIFQLGQQLLQQNKTQSWRTLGFNDMERFSQDPLKFDMGKIFNRILAKVEELGLQQ